MPKRFFTWRRTVLATLLASGLRLDAGIASPPSRLERLTVAGVRWHTGNRLVVACGRSPLVAEICPIENAPTRANRRVGALTYGP